MRTTSFQSIDFTTADIPARVSARVDPSDRKDEVPLLFATTKSGQTSEVSDSLGAETFSHV